MNKNRLTIIFVLLVFQAFASADLIPVVKPPVPAELCPDRLLGFENIQIQQTLSRDRERCYLSIHPRDAFETLVYRDYLLTNDGLFMVFNSYAENGPNADGAREFFFLTNEFKGFQWKTEGDSLIVTGFADKTLKVSLKTSQITEISGAQVAIAEKVLPNNRGGFEILKADVLVIDAGFKMGDSPSNSKSSRSIIKNPKQQSCTLKNTQVYDYTEDNSYLKALTQLRSAASGSCKGFEI